MRAAISGANVSGPKGSLDGAHQSYMIAANDQIAAAAAYNDHRHRLSQRRAGALRDVANVIDGLENAKVGGWYQGKPAVVIDIQRQPGANVIDTVQRIKRELPRLQTRDAGSASSSPSSATAPRRSARRCATCSSR